MIVQLGSALRRAGRTVAVRPRAALWALLALVCALAAIGLAGVTAENIEFWTAAPRGSSSSMVVYLAEGVDEARAQVLTEDLAKMPGVEHAELVSPAETARRLEAALGQPSEPSSLLEGVEVASLPASVELTLAPGVRDVIAMSPTVRELRGTPGVDDLAFEDGAAEGASGRLSAIRAAVWVGAALLAGLAVLVVLAVIRIRLERDPEEQRVLSLLGASPAFTILPTALAGVIHGFAAAALAAIVLAIGLSHYDLVPSLSQVALLLAIGTGLGLFAGGLAGVARAAA